MPLSFAPPSGAGGGAAGVCGQARWRIHDPGAGGGSMSFGPRTVGDEPGGVPPPAGPVGGRGVLQAGSEVSYALAFPPVQGSRSPLARAKRPDGQGK